MPKSTRTESRYSVCIGINQYHPTAGLSTLRYAESDARAMDALLSQLGFEAENRCLLLGEEATLDAVNTALATMLLDTAGENDLIVFYFAGHSLPLIINQREVEEQGAERRSEVFLTTYDFDSRTIQQRPSFRKQHALGMERLRKEYFEGEGSRKRLFIFDSCYSGDFYGRQYRDEADPVQGYIRHMLDSTSTGRVALSSCLPIQKAVEDPTLGHGRFTYYLLKALSGEAVEALSRDGCLTVNGLFDYVAKQLPQEQRPVLSGVQQDSFELVCYPDKAAPLRLPKVKTEDTEDSRQRERRERLKALIIDHSGFIQSRLESFVGREQELAAIRQHISALLPTGGYLTITGQAGQGKSSIIARLVQDSHPNEVAHHFIPFNPGPDHQVSLLRDLMAQLILKHDLGDYYVTSESRPALRDFFPKVLSAIAAKGKQEVIYIDGLDQLMEDLNGERDLSFLPGNPPRGIVFVLGTRPNETLQSLELRKPHHSFHLPGLTREDFDLILQHRNVRLEPGLADQFYKVMEENALYLDLAAKELAQAEAAKPEEIIDRVSDDPENIFSLSTTRLKRHAVEWREMLKPLLGVLLVAREPLTGRQLRSILDLDDERLREGIARLGGLVADDGKNRYTLFHLKLYDYLRQDENRPHKAYIFARDEEESLHNTLARWCERGDLSLIWEQARHDLIEQERREYARKHYITHLYLSHEWQQSHKQRLFEILDTVQYGQAKIRDDPSTHSYALDLDLGRQATVWEGWTLEEGMALLPRLWQYTLLRCSLTSRADQYPEEAFQLLILLGRKQEVLGLAEMLTNLAVKARVLQYIAKQLVEKASKQSEWLELLMRAGEVVRTIQDSSTRAEVFSELGTALAQAGQWAEAEHIISDIRDNSTRAEAFSELGTALAQAGQWAEAKRIISAIWDSSKQARAFSALGTALAQAGQWAEAKRIIETIQGSFQQARALSELGAALAQAGLEEQASQMWAETERIIGTIQDSSTRAEALRVLGTDLAQAGLEEQASQVWAEAKRIISTIWDSSKQARALSELGADLAQAGLEEQASQAWAEAEHAIGTIQGSSKQARAFSALGAALAQAGLKEQASQAWAEAEHAIGTIQNSSAQAEMLRVLGTALAQAGQWTEAKRIIETIQNSAQQARALSELGAALAQAGQWTEAKRIISTIQDSSTRAEAFSELGTALAQAGQWAEAKRIISAIWDSSKQARALSELGAALAQAGLKEQASQVWAETERIISTIQGSSKQARALSELGTALAQAGLEEQASQAWAEAEHAIGTIQGSFLRAGALSELGIVLAQAGLEEQASQVWAEAKRVIGTIQNSSTRTRALSELGTALAQAGQWTEAKRIISAIQNSAQQARALSELGAALAQAGLEEQASQVWAETEHAIDTIQDSSTRTRALSELGTALAQAGQWTEAKRIISAIQNSSAQARALSELGAALAQAGLEEQASQVWAEAKRIISTIWDSSKQARALSELGAALAQAGLEEQASQAWAEAEHAIGTIQGSSAQARAFSALGTALAQAGQWAEAKRIIETIQDSSAQTRALRALSITLAQAGQWTEAKRIIETIQDSSAKARALRALGIALAQAGLEEQASQVWAEAKRIIGTIQGSSAQAEALRNMATILARTDKREQLLHVIQRSWRQAETREEALTLFSVVCAVISRKPEVGIACITAFNWVDTFLGKRD